MASQGKTLPEQAVHEAAPVRDRRIPPRGVLPRQLQTWLMLGIAGLIVAIILIAGHPQPPTSPRSTPAEVAPTLASPDRIRTYQQRLAAEEVRQRDAEARQTTPILAETRTGGGISASPASVEARRPAPSLHADNIALSRRPADQQPYAARARIDEMPVAAVPSSPPALDHLEQTLTRILAQLPPPNAPRRDLSPVSAPVPETAAPAFGAATDPSRGASRSTTTDRPASGVRFPLWEGTVIETALLNRLDGTFAGPVACLVTTPVYSQDRQRVLIPAGARVLGAAAPVQAWGDARLSVSFHRLLMPDGHSYSLNRFTGLDTAGDTGLRDRVDRHYAQVFGASLAIGVLSGLAQYTTRGVAGVADFGDEFRQSSGGSLASSASRVLDRYLNVLPTVTIREGHRIKVYLTNDFELPAYAPVPGEAR
ncbi:MAG: TrbI/VirB10 family protein [Acidobacteriota bacterium]